MDIQIKQSEQQWYVYLNKQCVGFSHDKHKAEKFADINEDNILICPKCGRHWDAEAVDGKRKGEI